MTATREEIREQLKRMETDENVKILYACESGSRAWGFPSRDSDYDVRFLYIRPENWYLSIFPKRDVIERPISGLLDINGWDLRKALQLFRKSNPPLLEWLQSPIVYLEDNEAIEPIRRMAPGAFSPKACMHHYLHMAQGNYREYLRGERVKLKKYFYVLRPVLACRWIERYGEMPPVAFESLAALLPAGAELEEAVSHLLARKRAGEELNDEPRIDCINDYLEHEIAYFAEKAPEQPTCPISAEEALDRVFRETLKRVWRSDRKK